MNTEPAPPPRDAQRPQPGASQASRMVSRLLDDLVRVPGTNFGFGLDGVLGLIPGVGDASTTALAGIILADAIRNRVPLPVLARMGVNLGVDALLGMVPLIGDLADFAHRANRRNLMLLERTINDREQTRMGSVVYLTIALVLVVLTVGVLVAALLWTLWLLWRIVVPR